MFSTIHVHFAEKMVVNDFGGQFLGGSGGLHGRIAATSARFQEPSVRFSAIKYHWFFSRSFLENDPFYFTQFHSVTTKLWIFFWREHWCTVTWRHAPANNVILLTINSWRRYSSGARHWPTLGPESIPPPLIAIFFAIFILLLLERCTGPIPRLPRTTSRTVAAVIG